MLISTEADCEELLPIPRTIGAQRYYKGEIRSASGIEQLADEVWAEKKEVRRPEQTVPVGCLRHAGEEPLCTPVDELDFARRKFAALGEWRDAPDWLNIGKLAAAKNPSSRHFALRSILHSRHCHTVPHAVHNPGPGKY